MIMLLEQDQMGPDYRWHLTFAFGLLTTLLKVIDPNFGPAKIPILLYSGEDGYFGGPARYCPEVLQSYISSLNDLSIVFIAHGDTNVNSYLRKL